MAVSLVSSVIGLTAACGGGLGEPPAGSPGETTAGPHEQRGFPEERPSDFGFILRYGAGGRDQIDTFSNTFTRDMGDEPPMQDHVPLSSVQLDEVFGRMKDLGVDGLPREFRPGGTTGSAGSAVSDFHLRVRADGQEYEVVWQDTGSSAAEAVALRGLFGDIQRMVEDHSAYGEMLLMRSRTHFSRQETAAGATPIPDGAGAAPPGHEVAVPNPGFEKDRTGWSWYYWNTHGEDCAGIDYDALSISTDAHSGGKAALLTARGDILLGVATDVPEHLLIDRDGTYTLAAFLNIDGAPGVIRYADMAVIRWTTVKADVVGGEQTITSIVGRSEIIAWETGYHEHHLGGLALRAGDRVDIQIGFVNSGQADSRLYVDDVRLYVPDVGQAGEGPAQD